MMKKYNLCGTIILLVIALIIPIASTSFSVQAQSNDDQQWWFNVELIVFKRTLLPNNNERFGPAIDMQTNGENDANNMLYLAALKNDAQFASYAAALPKCGIDATAASVLGTFVDFDFQPLGHTYSVTIENEVLKEKADDIITGPLPQLIDNLLVSNKTAIAELLSPFDTRDFNVSSTNDADISTSNNASDAPNNTNKLDPITEYNVVASVQETLLALTNRIAEMNQQLQDITNSNISLYCISNDAQAPLSIFVLPRIGPRIFSTDSTFTGKKQLIAADDLVLQDYAQSVFRQRDITPILYTGWRQQVKFGIENAEFIRVRAGSMLQTSQKKSYEEWQQSYLKGDDTPFIKDDIAFFEILQQSLDNNQTIDWLTDELYEKNINETPFAVKKEYEIDGKIKVYLDYVSQIPYLHIDSEFNRFSLALDENGDSKLSAFPFKQRRRIISKQIHYFDHPAFGIIVRLERFTPPASDEDIPNDTDI
jgi:hypothetical protein